MATWAAEAGLNPYVQDMKELEFVKPDKIKRYLGDLGPLKPEATGVDWASWFMEYGRRLLVQQVPRKQWHIILEDHSHTGIKTTVSLLNKHARKCRIPEYYIYGFVRDRLLLSKFKYRPPAYFHRIHHLHAGNMDPSNLARLLEDLATKYEAARKRSVLRMQKYPEITHIYLACLYHRLLPDGVREKIKHPHHLRISYTESPYQAVVTDAKNIWTNLGKSSGWNGEAEINSEQLKPPTAAGVRHESAPPSQRRPPCGASNGSKRADRQKRPLPPKDSEQETLSPTPQNRQKLCVHCGCRGHYDQQCYHWTGLVDSKPHLKDFCPKCLKGKHEPRLCRMQKGMFWGTQFYQDTKAAGSGKGSSANAVPSPSDSSSSSSAAPPSSTTAFLLTGHSEREKEDDTPYHTPNSPNFLDLPAHKIPGGASDDGSMNRG